MSALNASSDCAPDRRLPLTKKVGVEFTPISSASAIDASISALVSPLSKQSLTFAGSAPASFAMPSSFAAAVRLKRVFSSASLIACRSTRSR